MWPPARARRCRTQRKQRAVLVSPAGAGANYHALVYLKEREESLARKHLLPKL